MSVAIGNYGKQAIQNTQPKPLNNNSYSGGFNTQSSGFPGQKAAGGIANSLVSNVKGFGGGGFGGGGYGGGGSVGHVGGAFGSGQGGFVGGYGGGFGGTGGGHIGGGFDKEWDAAWPKGLDGAWGGGFGKGFPGKGGGPQTPKPLNPGDYKVDSSMFGDGTFKWDGSDKAQLVTDKGTLNITGVKTLPDGSIIANGGSGKFDGWSGKLVDQDKDGNVLEITRDPNGFNLSLDVDKKKVISGALKLPGVA